MALYYNLTKVYAVSQGSREEVIKIMTTFVRAIFYDLEQIEYGIWEREYDLVCRSVLKIKPLLDVLGLDVALEEVFYIEAWAMATGKKKEIKQTYQNCKDYIKKAVKEIKKDFKAELDGSHRSFGKASSEPLYEFLNE